MASVLDDSFYHQTKTPISFWCRRRLNPRFFIQPSETLLIELTGTHYYAIINYKLLMAIFALNHTRLIQAKPNFLFLLYVWPKSIQFKWRFKGM